MLEGVIRQLIPSGALPVYPEGPVCNPRGLTDLGEHFLDGGIVNSIPVGRAVGHGARTIYVMHVGRVDHALEPPRWPWEVGLVAFEIARRHRFAADMADLPPEVTVHVLPSGSEPRSPRAELDPRNYRRTGGVSARMDRAYDAGMRYLGAGEPGGSAARRGA